MKGNVVEGTRGSDFQSLFTRNNANEMHAKIGIDEDYPTSSFDPLFM